MQVSKQQVVGFIRDRGDAARADEAELELPDSLELPKDAELVMRYGVDPTDLAGDEPDHGGAAPGGQSGAAADQPPEA